ncbi:CoA-transferase [Catenulispora rubra]|uniref:CoA-transferase n=1 Tax=Catenulispora rubra TaxID=280293 RepID=UPI002B26EC77|nr:CoA-transferase [Catenulispora rubra]
MDDLVRRFVRPDMHLHFAATLSRPNALIYAVARVLRGAGRLTVSTTAVHSSAHALALSGAVRHVESCFFGDTYPSPRPNRIYRDLAVGLPFTAQTWSLLSYTQRLVAGATGTPYAVTASLAGSDLTRGKEADLWSVPDPAVPGGHVTLLRPMRPDLTLVHGVCADRRGNVVLCAPLGEGPWAAYAATGGVLASVERIVPDEVVDAHPDRVVIPGQRVIGLAEAELGAHPQSLRSQGVGGVTGYRDDYDFMTEIVRDCADADTAEEWFRTWVTEPGGHDGYLKALGRERIEALALDHTAPERDGADRDVETAGGQPKPTTKQATEPVTEPPTEQERLLVLAARAIIAQVETGGYDTLLAGIGSSHMAAWLAAALLRERGRPVRVAAELGFFGMDPEPGDVFLFSQAHAQRSEQLSSILEILGAQVAGNRRCLGVLAAAEVDEEGNLNTTLLPDGRWVTGSGGANDIASTADCLVVAPASPRRYVPRVCYVTSPGHRVREVVSQFGRFQRPGPGEPFQLRSWLPTPKTDVTAGPEGPEGPEGPDGPDTPDELIARHTRWTVKPAGDARPEPDITPAELALLRRLDPEGHYR